MIKKIRKFGFLSKGFVYVTIGILTLLTALKLGGKVSDKNGVITFLENQIFGKILLIIVGFGMFSYAIWRFYKSYFVIKKEEKKTKYLLSIDYFIRGIVYSSFAISVLFKVFNQSKNGISKESAVAKILQLETGKYILYAIAIIIFFSAINQFYIVYKNIFLENVEKSKNITSFSFLEKTGKFGITARGISFLIFSWFIFKATSDKNPSKIKGTQEMFSYLQNLSFGSFLMGIMALGFISYGVFQYFYGRYSSY